MSKQTGLRKQKAGVVVSDKMEKTRVVRVERMTRHSTYGKSIRVFKNYKAHDEKNEAKMGDHVRITETRPLSKDKRWRITEVLKAGEGETEQ